MLIVDEALQELDPEWREIAREEERKRRELAAMIDWDALQDAADAAEADAP